MRASFFSNCKPSPASLPPRHCLLQSEPRELPATPSTWSFASPNLPTAPPTCSSRSLSPTHELSQPSTMTSWESSSRSIDADSRSLLVGLSFHAGRSNRKEDSSRRNGCGGPSTHSHVQTIPKNPSVYNRWQIVEGSAQLQIMRNCKDCQERSQTAHRGGLKVSITACIAGVQQHYNHQPRDRSKRNGRGGPSMHSHVQTVQKKLPVYNR
jgi:hypothetical protein